MSCGVTEKIVNASRPCSAARCTLLWVRAIFEPLRAAEVAAFDHRVRRVVWLAFPPACFDRGRAVAFFVRRRWPATACFARGGRSAAQSSEPVLFAFAAV